MLLHRNSGLALLVLILEITTVDIHISGPTRFPGFFGSELLRKEHQRRGVPGTTTSDAFPVQRTGAISGHNLSTM